jgi:small subunit ribosomal protein S15
MNSKQDLVKKYQAHKKDTGSVDVQVALMTQKIADLAKHLKKHAKDSDSRRGLLMMVGKRRRLLNYLKKNDAKAYDKLIKDLGLKK